MKTFLIHHTPSSPKQDTWAVSFSLPYIATRYAHAGAGVWYVETWLSADQIKRRLAVLFDERDQLGIHELGRHDLGRDDKGAVGRAHWMNGRLEDDEPADIVNAPRLLWQALQSAVQAFAPPRAALAMAATQGNSRAA